MAETFQPNQATNGGKPPPAAKPRVSAHFPWQQEQGNKSRSENPAKKTPLEAGGHTGKTGSPEESVVSEENALLEELDEVLSSTTESKTSRSTTESRLSTERGSGIERVQSTERVPSIERVQNTERVHSTEKVQNSERVHDSEKVHSTERVSSNGKADKVQKNNKEPTIGNENGSVLLRSLSNDRVLDYERVPSIECPAERVLNDNLIDLNNTEEELAKLGFSLPGGREIDVIEEGIKGEEKGELDQEEKGNEISMSGGQEVSDLVMNSRAESRDTRTPRYAGRQFTNYEDILDNLDSEDPYSQELKPSSRKPPSAQKPKTKTNRKSPKTAKKHGGFNNKSGESDNQSNRKQGPPKRASKKGAAAKEVMNGFENPAFDGSERMRRNSTDSNRTYTVGMGDSRAALLDDNEKNKKRAGAGAGVGAGGGEGQGRRVSAGVENSLGSCFILNPYGLSHSSTGYSGKEYIKSHIRHRQCSKYIPAAGTHDTCGCGLKKEDHHHLPTGHLSADHALISRGDKWSVDDHTMDIEPDTFGTIAFQGFGHEIADWAPYVRVSEGMRHRNLSHLWGLMSNVWKMPPPKMIVSVTGGAKRFFMKNRIRKSFQRGLINVATSSGAWIVTGGTGTGVMQFVGEAVREYQLAAGSTRTPVVALGITTWGTVDNKEALISRDKNGLSPATYHLDDLTYAKRTAPLDPNHTHFILVDDGTTSKFGREIKFRAGLERFISKTGLQGLQRQAGDSTTRVSHVPVVLLVLEGGTNSLKTTLEAIKEHTPIVVIQGSGRAADFIALGYKETKNDTSTFDQELQEERALEMFDWSRADIKDRDIEIDKCVAYLREILSPSYRHLVTVFHIDDVDSTKEIDEAILYALLQAEGAKLESQLSLAIAWNRCDIAKQQIFDFGSGNKVGKIGKTHMKASMMTALLQNSTGFVQLFLDNGFDLTNFLTKRTLRSLYDEVLCAKSQDMAAGILRSLLLQQNTPSLVPVFANLRRESWQPNQENMLRNVGRIITSLLGDYNENLYRGPENIISPMGDDPGESQSPVTKETAGVTQVMIQQSIQRSKSGTAERDLFLWAVLLNRQELAHVFWKAGKDHIGGALVASSLLKSLGDYATDEEEIDLANDLYAAAVNWEEIAVGVLNECYLRDKELAHKLLVREIDTWAGSTLMVIADTAEQMDFMGHSCCQTKLNRIWKGKMALYTSTWKILLCMFMPFFLPSIRFYTGEFAALFRPARTENKPSKKIPMTSLNKVGQYTDSYHDNNGTHDQGAGSDGSTSGTPQRMSRSPPCHRVVAYIYYYHTAPVTKFCYHMLSYIVFLGLFSYVILTDLQPMSVKTPSILEYVVWGWAGSLLLEEFRQIATRSPRKVMRKLAGYFDSVWNRYDIMMNIMLIISIVLRHTLSVDNFVWARIFYALSLAMYYLRFMQFFYVEKNIGPKVIMIRRMLTDLSFFVAIMLTVILAYGIAVQSLRYPNSDPQWSLLKDILYKPYWNIYGELFLEDFEGENADCSSDPAVWRNSTLNVARCPESNWLATTMFAVYMIMTNILLLNLLIAMFSYTFEKVQENSEKVWRYIRYSLVYEYYDKPTLAPPLIIFTHFWRMLKYFLIKCGCRLTYETDFRKREDEQRNMSYTAFERAGMEHYLMKQHKTSREHIDAKVTTASDKIEKVIVDLEQIKEQVSPAPQTSTEVDITMTRSSVRSPDKKAAPRASDLKGMQERMQKVENNLAQQGNMLSKMMTYMEDLHKARTTVDESPRRGQHRHHDDIDHQGAGITDHVTKLQDQLNEHAYIMEKLMTIVEDMSTNSGRTVTPTQVNYRSKQTSTSASTSSLPTYRRRTYTREPSIEIQDIQGGSSN